MVLTFLVLAVIVSLVVVLYLDKVRPSVAFLTAVIIFILLQVIKPEEFLQGLANKQVIVIFMLIILTAGIKEIFGANFFYSLFPQEMSSRRFSWKMTSVVGGLSALLNNTPIVAFMIPYVREWSQRKGVASSRFFIPLSYATILGGTITVIGTSTNLVLNGLISSYNLPVLGFQDFFFLGLSVALPGILYLNVFSKRLLPDRNSEMDAVSEKLNEYIIETSLEISSPMIGKTVQEAGLRQLKKLFLVEIIRNGKAITPVAPDMLIEEGDQLYFAGNTSSIFELLKEKNGIIISDHLKVEKNAHFQFTEAVIPSHSIVVGQKVKDSDFRKRFKASIIAIQRKGQHISRNLGDEVLQAGDLLLLLKSKEESNGFFQRDLILISPEKSIALKTSGNAQKGIGIGVLLLLVAGITGLLDLFTAAMLGIFALVVSRTLSLEKIRRSIDVELLIVLVSSLAMGVALLNSGAAHWISEGIYFVAGQENVALITVLLFLITLLLTSLITNPAAVALVFPIALEISQTLHLSSTPFFVIIAFAASGDFMTPIGYQTNLMVMGPGNYKFKDYFRIGFPLTLMYSLICISFVLYYYDLI